MSAKRLFQPSDRNISFRSRKYFSVSGVIFTVSPLDRTVHLCYVRVYYIILLSKCQVNFLLTIYYRILREIKLRFGRFVEELCFFAAEPVTRFGATCLVGTFLVILFIISDVFFCFFTATDPITCFGVICLIILSFLWFAFSGFSFLRWSTYFVSVCTFSVWHSYFPFLAVLAACLKFFEVGAPLLPTLRICLSRTLFDTLTFSVDVCV
jgi:hypothetical protein